MTNVSLDSARETIAIFDRKISEAEAETRARVDRMVAAGGAGCASEAVAKEWDKCEAELRMIRESREALVKAVATIIGMVPPCIVLSDAS